MKDVADFDRRGCAGFEQERFDAALSEQTELFVNHLAIARQLEAWSEAMRREPHFMEPLGKDFTKGYREALLTFAAFLRQGDYLPDGDQIKQVRTFPDDEDETSEDDD